MSSLIPTSRQRFRAYIAEIRSRRQEGKIANLAPGSKSSVKPANRSALTLFRRFLGLIAAHRWSLTLSLGTLTISSLLELIPPAVTKLAIDYILPQRPLPETWTNRLGLPTDGHSLLWLLGAGLFAISLLQSSIRIWGRWHATRITKRVQSSVRKMVFEHAVRLPLHRIFQIKSGGVASILREDAGGVGDLVFSMLYNPWRAVVQLAGCLAVLAWVDWRLLVGSLAILPCVYFSHRTWISRIRPLHRDVRNTRQSIDGHATEAFGGMRIVRAFGRQRSEAGRFLRGNHLMARQELNAWWWSRAIELVWQVLIPLGSAVLLVYGGSRVLDQQLSIGDLTMFLFYLAMLLAPMAVLATSAAQFQSSLAGLDRVLDLLEEPRESGLSSELPRLRLQQVEGRIHFEAVSFSYPTSERVVLDDINLDVDPGETIALVGPSGAGKTTFCNLVARFYDPTSGTVKLDGEDLRRWNVEGYRQLLGIVEQEVFLFDGTIAQNIGYGGRGASRAQVLRAAELSNAHGFIMELDQGYETVVGERGVKLSGGQRQRIAIARAIVSNPKILILDEATSNLDTDSERLIQASLHELMKGRTSFVIAHRLSTIRAADRIVVLDSGRIIEIGSHDELMNRSSRYSQMVKVQTGESTPK